MTEADKLLCPTCGESGSIIGTTCVHIKLNKGVLNDKVPYALFCCDNGECSADKQRPTWWIIRKGKKHEVEPLVSEDA